MRYKVWISTVTRNFRWLLYVRLKGMDRKGGVAEVAHASGRSDRPTRNKLAASPVDSEIGWGLNKGWRGCSGGEHSGTQLPRIGSFSRLRSVAEGEHLSSCLRVVESEVFNFQLSTPSPITVCRFKSSGLPRLSEKFALLAEKFSPLHFSHWNKGIYNTAPIQLLSNARWRMSGDFPKLICDECLRVWLQFVCVWSALELFEIFPKYFFLSEFFWNYATFWVFVEKRGKLRKIPPVFEFPPRKSRSGFEGKFSFPAGKFY